MVDITCGNYNPTELIHDISSNLASYSIDISYNSNTGKTTITNTDTVSHTITFYDPSGLLLCSSDGSHRSASKFNNNLGWILGFRGNINLSQENPLYGQLVYTIDASSSIVSESIVDTFGSKYMLLVLDDFNQNHLNKGLVGITPTQKNAEVPSYWNADLSCITTTIDDPYDKKIASYTQNAPRRLTQAQLYTLNQK